MPCPKPDKKSVKIAILGGTFDPITKGHIAIAQAVLAETDMDQVWLQPCYKHPYASKSKASNFEMRCCMVWRATEDLRHTNGICPSNFERKLATDGYKGPFTTYKILQQMMATPNLSRYQFSYIIGMDNANEFHKWKNYRKLRKLIPFIVVPRDGVKPNPTVTWYRSAPHTLLKTSVGDISSTQVREAVKAGNWDRVGELVDPSVKDFIRNMKLYGGRET